MYARDYQHDYDKSEELFRKCLHDEECKIAFDRIQDEKLRKSMIMIKKKTLAENTIDDEESDSEKKELQENGLNLRKSKKN